MSYSFFTGTNKKFNLGIFINSFIFPSLTGSPIGRIVVKGGKNPGGKMMLITTNDKGEF